MTRRYIYNEKSMYDEDFYHTDYKISKQRTPELYKK